MTSFKKILVTICISVLPAFICSKADAQALAVKTDALMWAGLTPNLSLELSTGERTTFELSGFGHKNPYGLVSEIVSVQPQFRYWFGGRTMIREFVGVAALFTTYDMTMRQQLFGKGTESSPYQVLDGDAVGLGITGGYVFAIGGRFNVELSCGFGVAAFRQKKYFQGGADAEAIAKESAGPNSKGFQIIPIDLGVTLTYILK